MIAGGHSAHQSRVRAPVQKTTQEPPRGSEDGAFASDACDMEACSVKLGGSFLVRVAVEKGCTVMDSGDEECGCSEATRRFEVLGAGQCGLSVRQGGQG